VFCLPSIQAGGGTMWTKFWQNYFLGKGFAKTSADLFLNSDVANGKGLGRNFPFAPLFVLGEFGAGIVIN